MKLTAKQRLFADEYIKSGNATQSAIKAGYSPKTVRSIGQENLTKPDIKSYIDAKMAEIESHKIADAKEVLQFYTRVLRKEETEEVALPAGDDVVTVEKKPSFKDRLAAAKELMKRYPLSDPMVQAELRKLNAEADIVEQKVKLLRNDKDGITKIVFSDDMSQIKRTIRIRKEMKAMEQTLSLQKIVGGGYYDFWHDKHFYRVVKGSRASKKSKTTALNMIYRLMKYPWSNLLVVRRYSNTNRQSTYADLVWAIHRFHAEHLFKCNPSMPVIVYKPTGQRIIFRGMDKPLKLTSITVTHGYLSWVWIEEAYEIESEDKFETLQESIRGRIDAPGAFKQITVTFNPWNAQHWLKRTFFDPKTRKDDTFAQTTTFRCNEWLDEKDKQRYLDLYKTNPRRARVSADGEWGVSEGLVFEDNVELIDFDPQEKLTECGHAGFGLDYGFGGDPNAFVALAIDPKNKNIWIYDEMYTYHQTTPHIAEWLKKNGYQHASIYADSASPERTQQLLDLGIDNIQSVVKTPIEAGIDQLWQYKIHVHPKCKNIWNEFNNYVFDTDNIGNTLNRPKDENNHAIDALRYSVRQYMDMYDGSMGVDWGNQYHIAREMGLDI